MIATVVRGNAHKQEVWRFCLVDSYMRPFFGLEGYRIEIKKPGQRKWHMQEEWDRRDTRNKDLPPLPDNVVAEAREQLIAQIRKLGVQPLSK